MNWTEVNIYTATEGADILCASLMDIGIKGFAIKDPNDFNEFLENKEGKWDYIDDDLMELSNCETCVTVYIPDNAQGGEILLMLKALIKQLSISDKDSLFGRLELETNSVKEEDWANNWKQYFKPIEIGQKLTVKPSWEEYNNIENRVILKIDPASSFGTGQHNTTKLCLELLEKAIHPGNKVLDLGCGSGILSIGAMLLGASYVSAVDIEENSVATALENAKLNNISADNYKAYCGNIITDKSLIKSLGNGYNIITANIVADVLIAMSVIFKNFLCEDGNLIVSGIITERQAEVTDAIKDAGFKVVESVEADGWSAVWLKL